MRFIETSVEIEAGAMDVWDVLTDFPSYGREGWNEYIRSIEAPLTSGARATIDTYTEKMGERTLKSRLVNVTFPLLTWEVRLPGLMRAMHYFRIEAIDAHRSRFIKGEQVSGLLTRAVFHMVINSRPGFEVFSDALKRRVEARNIPKR